MFNFLFFCCSKRDKEQKQDEQFHQPQHIENGSMNQNLNEYLEKLKSSSSSGEPEPKSPEEQRMEQQSMQEEAPYIQSQFEEELVIWYHYEYDRISHHSKIHKSCSNESSSYFRRVTEIYYNLSIQRNVVQSYGNDMRTSNQENTTKNLVANGAIQHDTFRDETHLNVRKDGEEQIQDAYAENNGLPKRIRRFQVSSNKMVRIGAFWLNVNQIVKKRIVNLDFPGVSGKQIRERYINKVDPEINKGPWTPEEDLIIFEESQRIGQKWSVISAKLHGRPV